MTTFKNKDEWSKAKEWSACINDALKMYNDSADPVPMKGYIYPDAAYIELTPDGMWHTIVANAECASYDLREVESYLWQWHSRHHAESSRDKLIDELNKYCGHHQLPKKSADELLASCQERRNTFQIHVDWLSEYLCQWEALED